MKHLSGILLALLLAFAAPSSQAAAPSASNQTEEAQTPEGVFFPKTFTLANGLRGVVITNHRAPVATHMVWYKTGAADEPQGKSGIAHYLEHLMFKGTPSMPPGTFSKTISKNGGNDNAFTSQDYTAYFQSIASDRLGLVMEMEADRMANLTLSPEVALPELAVILEERAQTIEASPARRLSEQVRAALYVHHPYGTPVIGWRHEMESFTPEDARSFYQHWYAPENAILIVSGDVELDEVKTLAQKHYGAIPASPQTSNTSARVRVKEPPLGADKRITLRDSQVRQPSWQRIWHAPSFSGEGAQHHYALQLLAEILGGGTTSRIYTALAVEQEIAVSAGAYYDGDGMGIGSFGVYATPRNETHIPAIEAEAAAQLERILKEGVSAEELAKAKTRMRRAAVFARDSVDGPARIFGSTLARGGTISDIEEWPQHIANVTLEQVREAARYVLEGKHHVTGILLARQPKEKELSKKAETK